MACESSTACPFLNGKMAARPGTAGLFKKRYCEGDGSNCARYLVAKALGKAAVPADLFPNEMERARALVNARAS